MMTAGRWIVAIFSVVGLGSLAAATTPDPVSYQASGQWVASGEDGRCILSRPFVHAADALTLEVEPLPLSSSIDITLKRPGRYAKTRWRKAKIGFDDGRSTVNTHALSFDSRTATETIDRAAIERADLDRSIATQSIDFRLADMPPIRLPIDKIGKALAILDKCESTIVASVGLTAKEIGAIATDARPPQMLYRVGDAYLRDDDKHDFADEAIARDIITPDGTVESCGLIHRADAPALNLGACHDWGSLRFTPARDAKGRPVRGLYFHANRWTAKALFQQ